MLLLFAFLLVKVLCVGNTYEIGIILSFSKTMNCKERDKISQTQYFFDDECYKSPFGEGSMQIYCSEGYPYFEMIFYSDHFCDGSKIRVEVYEAGCNNILSDFFSSITSYPLEESAFSFKSFRSQCYNFISSHRIWYDYYASSGENCITEDLVYSYPLIEADLNCKSFSSNGEKRSVSYECNGNSAFIENYFRGVNCFENNFLYDNMIITANCFNDKKYERDINLLGQNSLRSCNENYVNDFYTCNKTTGKDACNYHGRCAFHETCVCDTGYYGDYCEKEYSCNGYLFTKEESCNGRGVCVFTDKCECETGYKGDNCEEKVECEGIPFDDPQVCSGRGECIDGICECESLYEVAPDCSIKRSCHGVDADNEEVCSGNGDCVSQDMCECIAVELRRGVTYPSMYLDNNCSIIITCFGVELYGNTCNNRGHCEGQDLCRCDDDVYFFSQEKDCRPTNEYDCYGIKSDDKRVCNSHGYCASQDNCICDYSYFGEECQNIIMCGEYNISDDLACNGNGYCSYSYSYKEGKCICDNGYYGEFCEKNMSCFGYIYSDSDVCSGNGKCIYDDVCDCYSRKYGLECEVVLECSGIEYNDLNVCNNEGHCDMNGLSIGEGKCICADGFYGTECEISYEIDCPSTIYGECSGHGYCAAGDCICDQFDYSGDACEITRECNGIEYNDEDVCGGIENIRCGIFGKCDCPLGLMGDGCDEVSSCFGIAYNNPLVCSGHGSCIHGECLCEIGWDMTEDCSYFDDTKCFGFYSFDTEKVCSGHGICIGEDICYCDNHYSGEMCSEKAQCFGLDYDVLGVCSGFGDCIRKDTCLCDRNHLGNDCSVVNQCFGVFSKGACSNHGYCNKGKCACDAGWAKFEDCSEPNTCFGVKSTNNTVCSEHGDCVNENTCICNYNYYGKNCESLKECNGVRFDDLNACSGNGICAQFSMEKNDLRRSNEEIITKCFCKPQWTGDNCSEPVTCNGIRFDNPTSCTSEKNGFCISEDVCVCKTSTSGRPYSGADCATEGYICGGLNESDKNVCSGHGVCIYDGICMCDDGYMDDRNGGCVIEEEDQLKWFIFKQSLMSTSFFIRENYCSRLLDETHTKFFLSPSGTDIIVARFLTACKFKSYESFEIRRIPLTGRDVFEENKFFLREINSFLSSEFYQAYYEDNNFISLFTGDIIYAFYESSTCIGVPGSGMAIHFSFDCFSGGESYNCAHASQTEENLVLPSIEYSSTLDCVFKKANLEEFSQQRGFDKYDILDHKPFFAQDYDYYCQSDSYEEFKFLSFGFACEYFCDGIGSSSEYVCNGNGICTNTGCICDEGTSGSFCEEFKCNGIDRNDANVCNGHGECVSKDKCLCDSGYFDSSDGECIFGDTKGVYILYFENSDGLCLNSDNHPSKQFYADRKCVFAGEYYIMFDIRSSYIIYCLDSKCEDSCFAGYKIEFDYCFGNFINDDEFSGFYQYELDEWNYMFVVGYESDYDSFSDYVYEYEFMNDDTSCEGDIIHYKSFSPVTDDKLLNYNFYFNQVTKFGMTSEFVIIYYGYSDSDLKMIQGESALCWNSSHIAVDTMEVLIEYDLQTFHIDHLKDFKFFQNDLCFNDGKKNTKYVCSVYPVCNGNENPHACGIHGYCERNGVCKCDKGYYGDNCENFDCYGIKNDDPTVCNGKGQCLSPNVCKCDKKVHFNSKCECNAGWYGEDCDLTLCFGKFSNDTMICNSLSVNYDNQKIGKCTKNGECFCDSGFFGSDGKCSRYYCFGYDYMSDDVCNGRGNCTYPDTCECETGYFGPYCEFNTTTEISCGEYYQNDTEVCNGRGTCVERNRCDCSDDGRTLDNVDRYCECKVGYYGPTCSLYKCNGILSNDSSVCNGKGECLMSGDCLCEQTGFVDEFCECKGGYYGDNCDMVKCFGLLSNDSNVCSGRGECVSTNYCRCDKSFSSYLINQIDCGCNQGYSGDDCELISCFGIESTNKKVCSGHGECLFPDFCSCNETEYVSDSRGDCTVPVCYGFAGNSGLSCSGNGNCQSPNVCKCFQKDMTNVNIEDCSCTEDHYGVECDITECGPNHLKANEEGVCNDHGKCVEKECICDRGYDPSDLCLSEVYECFGYYENEEGVCSGHGVCQNNNECECENNYFGENCEVNVCNSVFSNETNTCSGYGDCYDYNECSCVSNLYTGQFCEVWKCNDILNSNTGTVCSGHGDCIGHNECNCFLHYKGDYCTEWNCYGLSKDDSETCYGHGKCEGYNSCDCDDGYPGNDCNAWDCYDVVFNSRDVCSGNGLCTDIDACSCLVGFYGNECEFWNCSGVSSFLVSEVCSGRGECKRPDLCICSNGYKGENCETFSCGSFSFNETEVCNGNGKCLSPNYCNCSDGYTGELCETSLSEQNTINTLVGISVSVGTIVFIIVIIIPVIIFLLVFFFTKQRKRLKKFAALKDVDLILREQELENDDSIAHLKIDKSLFEIDIKELTIMTILGTGGSGATVFLCDWKSQKVAFKCFRTNQLNSQSSFSEFEKEVSILGSLNHPHLVRFFGAVLEPPRVGIVMEYCEYGDLYNFLSFYNAEYKEYYPLEKKKKLLSDLASVMSYLHNRNVIHRDLKPENVLIDSKHNVKLMDFGVSKIVTNQTQARTKRIGTQVYMAPEIILGGNYTSKCDVFSFAILTYVCFTEIQEPYGKVGNIEIKAANNEFFRPDLSKLNFCSEWVQDFCKKNWDKDPEKRQSFEEIEETLSTKKIEKIVIKKEKTSTVVSKRKKNKRLSEIIMKNLQFENEQLKTKSANLEKQFEVILSKNENSNLRKKLQKLENELQKLKK